MSSKQRSQENCVKRWGFECLKEYGEHTRLCHKTVVPLDKFYKQLVSATKQRIEIVTPTIPHLFGETVMITKAVRDNDESPVVRRMVIAVPMRKHEYLTATLPRCNDCGYTDNPLFAFANVLTIPCLYANYQVEFASVKYDLINNQPACIVFVVKLVMGGGSGGSSVPRLSSPDSVLSLQAWLQTTNSASYRDCLMKQFTSMLEKMPERLATLSLGVTGAFVMSIGVTSHQLIFPLCHTFMSRDAVGRRNIWNSYFSTLSRSAELNLSHTVLLPIYAFAYLPHDNYPLAETVNSEFYQKIQKVNSSVGVGGQRGGSRGRPRKTTLIKTTPKAIQSLGDPRFLLAPPTPSPSSPHHRFHSAEWDGTFRHMEDTLTDHRCDTAKDEFNMREFLMINQISILAICIVRGSAELACTEFGDPLNLADGNAESLYTGNSTKLETCGNDKICSIQWLPVPRDAPQPTNIHTWDCRGADTVGCKCESKLRQIHTLICEDLRDKLVDTSGRGGQSTIKKKKVAYSYVVPILNSSHSTTEILQMLSKRFFSI
jgi:hypothetical protein